MRAKGSRWTDDDLVAVVMARAGGASFAAIGRQYGISAQAAVNITYKALRLYGRGRLGLAMDAQQVAAFERMNDGWFARMRGDK